MLALAKEGGPGFLFARQILIKLGVDVFVFLAIVGAGGELQTSRDLVGKVLARNRAVIARLGSKSASRASHGTAGLVGFLCGGAWRELLTLLESVINLHFEITFQL